MTVLVVARAGPLTTFQDAGRPGLLRHGVSASGPMDAAGFALAGAQIDGAGPTGIELTAGLSLVVEGNAVTLGLAGGDFVARVNGQALGWPTQAKLAGGDRLEIAPGAWGNYGYLRLDREIAVSPVLGSQATNLTARLGGLGRAIAAGDRIPLGAKAAQGSPVAPTATPDGPFRVVWGLHADLFPEPVRERFASTEFRVSTQIDRMGARLADPAGVFAPPPLTLVSDAVVPGDIQILGDGTPIVLLRDHQPTGGYPRIATIVSADLDRFAQRRPGEVVRFISVRPGGAER